MYVVLMLLWPIVRSEPLLRSMKPGGLNAAALSRVAVEAVEVPADAMMDCQAAYRASVASRPHTAFASSSKLA